MKIFQKIRRHLLAEGRFKNYVPYALGEIVLVVAGILIALQVNTWNEARKQAVTEAEFIAGIKNDLRQDRAFIKQVVQRADDKDQVFATLGRELFRYYETDRPALDSLLRAYFETQRTFYPVSGSFESAISGNEIGKFKNKAFSHAVTTLYNSTYARLADNGNNADERWFYLIKKYSRIRRTGHIPDMSPEQLNEFLDDMYFHMFGLNYYRDNLNMAVAKIDTILSL